MPQKAGNVLRVRCYRAALRLILALTPVTGLSVLARNFNPSTESISQIGAKSNTFHRCMLVIVSSHSLIVRFGPTLGVAFVAVGPLDGHAQKSRYRVACAWRLFG